MKKFFEEGKLTLTKAIEVAAESIYNGERELRLETEFGVILVELIRRNNVPWKQRVTACRMNFAPMESKLVRRWIQSEPDFYISVSFGVGATINAKFLTFLLARGMCAAFVEKICKDHYLNTTYLANIGAYAYVTEHDGNSLGDYELAKLFIDTTTPAIMSHKLGSDLHQRRELMEEIIHKYRHEVGLYVSESNLSDAKFYVSECIKDKFWCTFIAAILNAANTKFDFGEFDHDSMAKMYDQLQREASTEIGLINRWIKDLKTYNPKNHEKNIKATNKEVTDDNRRDKDGKKKRK